MIKEKNGQKTVENRYVSCPYNRRLAVQESAENKNHRPLTGSWNYFPRSNGSEVQRNQEECSNVLYHGTVKVHNFNPRFLFWAGCCITAFVEYMIKQIIQI